MACLCTCNNCCHFSQPPPFWVLTKVWVNYSWICFQTKLYALCKTKVVYSNLPVWCNKSVTHSVLVNIYIFTWADNIPNMKPMAPKQSANWLLNIMQRPFQQEIIKVEINNISDHRPGWFWSILEIIAKNMLTTLPVCKWRSRWTRCKKIAWICTYRYM
jgi:hypothetical protein